MSNDQIRAEVADRMSRTIGLPTSSVRSLMTEFSDEDVDRLQGLDDDGFKQESVKLVNKAQQRQFANIGKSDADTDAAASPIKPVAPVPVTAPSPQPAGGSSERKKIVIPMTDGGGAASSEATPSKIMVPPEPGSSGLTMPREGKKKASIKIDLGDSAPKVEAVPPEAQAPATPAPAGGGKKLQINMNAVAAASDAIKEATDNVVSVARKTESMHAVEAPAEPPSATIKAEEPGRMASGIKAVEPEKAGPLNISAKEQELLDEEVPKMVRNASLPSEGDAKEVSSAFKSKGGENEEFLSKKNMPLLIGAGVGGLLVIILLGYFIVTILFPGKPDPVAPPPNGKAKGGGDSGKGTVVDDPKEVKGFIGKWAWKHSESFEETFENGYFLPGRVGTVFTVEMWMRIQRVSGVKSVTLSAVGEKFILGMSTYRNKPILSFDVPDASYGKGGIRTAMPTGSGWLHIAGVYDPVTTKKIYLYVNGKEVGTKPVRTDPPLPASIFIFRGEIVSQDSSVLIDDVRMSNSIVYDGAFKPERNLGYDKNTAVLLQMEKKAVGDLYEVPNVADDKKALARFTKGEFVDVDTQNFKLAVERTTELERLMFEHYKKKWSAARYKKLVDMWPQAPQALKIRKLNEFEEMLEAQEKESKTPGGEGTTAP